MDELSKRHHYIPRFLIKNFADENNKLWVYNKQTGKFLKNKQSPKAVFFEWERNLFDINGSPGDNIEKIYGETDNLIAQTLDKVLTTDIMTGQELTVLIFLVSLMKWRIPKADMTVQEIIKNVSIENLGATFRSIDTMIKPDEETLDRIQNLDAVKEMKRILLTIQPLMNSDEFSEIHKNCFILSSDIFPALLGDCPIIEKPNTDFTTLKDFILPLSSEKTLICKKRKKKEIPDPIFYMNKDLTIFHLSEKYVACKTKVHLENVIEIYARLKNENKIHLLEKYVFDFIT